MVRPLPHHRREQRYPATKGWSGSTSRARRSPSKSGYSRSSQQIRENSS
jgi:hypothetical protein